MGTRSLRPAKSDKWPILAVDVAQSPGGASIGSVSALLAMDRTTLTANLKPLERRGLVKVSIVDADKRTRRLKLTTAGRALLVLAVPIWKQTHAIVEKILPRGNEEELRVDLRALS